MTDDKADFSVLPWGPRVIIFALTQEARRWLEEVASSQPGLLEEESLNVNETDWGLIKKALDEAGFCFAYSDAPPQPVEIAKGLSDFVLHDGAAAALPDGICLDDDTKFWRSE